MKRLWLLYLVLIFGLSSVPGTPRLSRSPIVLDKPVHILLYAGLTFVYVRSSSSGKESGMALLGQSLLLAAATGLGDELYQGLVPNRSPEFGDWLADICGGGCGAVIALIRRAGPASGEERNRT